MSEKITLTWPDGEHPMRIIDCNPVHYLKDVTVMENGKKVVKTTAIEYTACSVRPATPPEVRKWRNQ